MTLLENYSSKIQDLIKNQETNKNVFFLLEKAFQETIGHKLFTILKYDHNKFMLERMFTNKPIEYPTKGMKKLKKSLWQKCVFEDGNIYIGYNSEDIKNSFPDYELIFKLECKSVMNIPIVNNNFIKGSINILHKENWYNQSHIKSAKRLTNLIRKII